MSDDEGGNEVRRKRKKNDDDSENPLLTDLDHRDKKTKRIHKAELWFEKDVFKNLENEKDEDLELDQMVEEYKKKGGRILGEDDSADSENEDKGKKGKDLQKEKNEDDDDDGYTDDTDSDYDVEDMMAPNKKVKKNKVGGKDGFEIVPQGNGEYTVVCTLIIKCIC